MLKLLHSELSERDIGRELYVSHSTVHSHVRAIYRKLAVCSRAGASTWPRSRPPVASIPGINDWAPGDAGQQFPLGESFR